jgi:hypothetical protein
LHQSNAFPAQPVDWRKAGLLLKPAKKVTFTQAAEPCELCGTPGTLQVSEHIPFLVNKYTLLNKNAENVPEAFGKSRDFRQCFWTRKKFLLGTGMVG